MYPAWLSDGEGFAGCTQMRCDYRNCPQLGGSIDRQDTSNLGKGLGSRTLLDC
jgi:hypothetical protein